jgi:hypothetical protein
MFAGLKVLWKGRPVELVINCSSSAVDAFVQSAIYDDSDGEELVDESELEQIQDEYAGEIQEVAYLEMMECGNLNYSKR